MRLLTRKLFTFNSTEDLDERTLLLPPAAMELKLTWIFQAILAFHALPSLGFEHVLPRGLNQKPTRVLGNVTVIDTPL